MKIRSAILIAALVLPAKEYAQTQLNKVIPVKASQSISMNFDYPKLVKISTWDRNEISFQGTVSINNGENDEAFIIESSTNGNTVRLDAFIKDLKKLPERIVIMRDGQKIMFRDKEELKKYQQANGKRYSTMSWGPDIEIELTIKVPKNVNTIVKAEYGLVEVKNFEGPLEVTSTYGGVDAAVSETSTGQIFAETNFGDIFTNLNAKFGGDGHRQDDFHTAVSATPGNGPRYSFGSKFGNVYIRRAD